MRWLALQRSTNPTSRCPEAERLLAIDAMHRHALRRPANATTPTNTTVAHAASDPVQAIVRLDNAGQGAWTRFQLDSREGTVRVTVANLSLGPLAPSLTATQKHARTRTDGCQTLQSHQYLQRRAACRNRVGWPFEARQTFNAISFDAPKHSAY
jgi:hypothetical protein